MNPTTTVTREVQSLIEAVCDGMADDAQVRDLESLLLTDEEACNFYVDLLDLDAKLQRLVGSLQEGDAALKEFIAAKQTPSATPAPTFLSTALPRTLGYFSAGWPVAYLVATVITGLWLLGMWLTPVSRTGCIRNPCRRPLSDSLHPNRRLIGGPDHRHGRLQIGNPGTTSYPPMFRWGRSLSLASGLMEITYDTGAKVILQGPVTY